MQNHEGKETLVVYIIDLFTMQRSFIFIVTYVEMLIKVVDNNTF